MKKLLVISLLVIGAAVYWFISNQTGDLVSSQVQTGQAKVTLTPTPTPYPIDEGTDLEEALDTLTPSDYSSEYQNLTDK